MAHPLDRLLAPQSVAIVGASDKPDTNGAAMLEMCQIDGYRGRVYPVNPRLALIGDAPCYSSLAALPEVPEHVVIGVASHLVEEILDQAIALGIGSATIFASCFLEDDPAPRLTTRIAQKARSAGMPICGANCMGFYTTRIGLRIASMPSPPGLRRGGIAWIVQSGSALGALAHNDRRLGFSICVSTGMELATTAADYMDWALHQHETRVIGLFLESVRDPERFVEMLRLAAHRRVPVVVLKVGRTETSARMAVSHTGAIAGNDAAFDALCRKHGVIRVGDLDEMAATLALFDTESHIGAGGLATMHDSGGERELVVDLADDLGIAFPALEEPTCDAIEAHLEPGLRAENPLDAYGTSRDVERRYAMMLAAMANDPNIAMGFFMANPRDGYAYAEKYTAALKWAAGRTRKPLALVSNYAMTSDAGLALELAEAGIPLLRGTRNALRAAQHRMAYRDFHAQSSSAMPEPQALTNAWAKRLSNGSPLSELEGLSLLRAFGIAVPRFRRITGEADLCAALADLTYPVALKTAENHAHKSDIGGVVLNLDDADAVRSAYAALSSRLGPAALVMEMAPKGTELALGAIWDEAFGPVVLISAGGVLIELFEDRVAALAPFDKEEARRLIERLRIHDVLTGVRGVAPVDLEALANQVSRFSCLVASLGNRVQEIDVNPVICSAEGVLAVDCLIVPAGT